MKILFTGSIYVGKSTLLSYLESLCLPGIGYIHEVGGEINSLHPELAGQQILQEMIFHEQMKREQEAERQGYRFIICDRGSLDTIAHCRIYGLHIKTEWIKHTRAYCHIYVLNKNDIPFNKSIYGYAPDRDWDDFRERMDKIIKYTLEDLKLPYEVLSGNVEKRAATVLAYLKSLS